MDETVEIPVTRDAILGGRVTLIQPERGHRAGHDAVLLAAAVPALPGERVLDLGSGVGAAAFALARRVPLGFLTLVEIDPVLARLAEANAALNGVGDRTRVIIMDARARGAMRERSGLLLGQIDRVLTNPPFHDAARHRASPQPGRRLAHQAPDDMLAGFLRTAVSVLRPGGTLTMIHRADQPEALLASLRGRFGSVMLRPVHARPGSPAIRLIVNAVKGSRAPVALLPGLILQDAAGRPTPEAEAVLREGAAL
jgi:tRNA1(Val) A37 N6-methylase TrmN6